MVDQQQRTGLQPAQREARPRSAQARPLRRGPALSAVRRAALRDAVQGPDQHQERSVAAFDEEMFIEEPPFFDPGEPAAPEALSAVRRDEEICSGDVAQRFRQFSAADAVPPDGNRQQPASIRSDTRLVQHDSVAEPFRPRPVRNRCVGLRADALPDAVDPVGDILAGLPAAGLAPEQPQLSGRVQPECGVEAADFASRVDDAQHNRPFIGIFRVPARQHQKILRSFAVAAAVPDGEPVPAPGGFDAGDALKAERLIRRARQETRRKQGGVQTVGIVHE